MPIYAYRCESCGHAKDVLQKVSDPVLTTCPACHAESFKKQLTAAGFQLKGSGWYVTDFRGGNGQAAAANGKGSNGDSAKPDAAASGSTGEPASAPASTGSGSGSAASGSDSASAAGCGGSCACH